MPADRRTIAFIPAASGSAEYAQHLGKYFHELDPTVEVRNVPIYRGRDGRRQKNADALLSAGMIYIGGGVTNSLLATVRESVAELAMREAAAKGTVIAAIGAGASAFGQFARDMRGVTPSLPGLGWLTSAVVETGFDPAADEPLRRLMSLREVRVGIGIPSRTALAIHGDGSTEVIGEGRIAAYRKNDSVA